MPWNWLGFLPSFTKFNLKVIMPSLFSLINNNSFNVLYSGAAPYGGGGGGGGGYDTGSPVYQAVHAADSGQDWNSPNPGAQSRSFKMLQQMTETDAPDASDYGKYFS